METENKKEREKGEIFTSQIDEELNQRVENAFNKATSQILLHEIVKIATEHDPIDLAHAVTRLPPAARIVVYENLPDFNAKISFIINTTSSTRTAIFRQIDDLDIKTLIENMPPDEAVEILDDMSVRRMKRVLDLLELKKASRIRELYSHEPHSAGRLMTNEFFAFHFNTTIGQVAATIRDNPGIELTRRIFVLNDAGELIGYALGRNLIINPHYIPLKQIMRPVLHWVTPDTSRDEVVDLVERYKIPALPVVDESNRLIGVITYEDIVEVMEDIADETIASIAGTAEDVREDLPILQRFFWRAPWLIVTLCAGLITATAMSYFSDRPWFVFVPFFVPLIAGMSGNVGIQCSTLLVRGMSTGELSYLSKREAVTKELGIGLLIGSIFGLACGIIVYLLTLNGIYTFKGDAFAAGVIVSGGVLGACLTATVLGTLSPLFFARMDIDPAVASGPIVTAFNDVLSTLMYFLVAKVVSLFLLT
jgi:magnesium transporter